MICRAYFFDDRYVMNICSNKKYLEQFSTTTVWEINPFQKKR